MCVCEREGGFVSLPLRIGHMHSRTESIADHEASLFIFYSILFVANKLQCCSGTTYQSHCLRCVLRLNDLRLFFLSSVLQFFCGPKMRADIWARAGNNRAQCKGSARPDQQVASKRALV